MNNKHISLLIAAFILLIVGSGFIMTIAVEEQDKTTFKFINNETVDISAARNAGGTLDAGTEISLANTYTSDWRQRSTPCVMTDFVLRNQTGATMTVTTDYVFNSGNGTFTVVNNTNMYSDGGNTTYVDYKYCATDYLTESWNRTILDLVPGFFGLMLVGIAVGLFYKILKEEGLLDRL